MVHLAPWLTLAYHWPSPYTYYLYNLGKVFDVDMCIICLCTYVWNQSQAAIN